MTVDPHSLKFDILQWEFYANLTELSKFWIKQEFLGMLKISNWSVTMKLVLYSKGTFSSRKKHFAIDRFLIFAVCYGLAMLTCYKFSNVCRHARLNCFEILYIIRNINNFCKFTEKHSEIVVNIYEICNNHEREMHLYRDWFNRPFYANIWHS